MHQDRQGVSPPTGGGKAFKSGRANGNLQHLYVNRTMTRLVTGISTSRLSSVCIGDEDTKDVLCLTIE